MADAEFGQTLADELEGRQRFGDLAVGAVKAREVTVTTILCGENNATAERGFDGDEKIVAVDPQLGVGGRRGWHLVGATAFALRGVGGAARDREPLALREFVSIADEGER